MKPQTSQRPTPLLKALPAIWSYLSIMTHSGCGCSLQRLLSSGVRTTDGDTADYFYVPMSIRAPAESMHMIKAIKYIRSNWPWWNRLDGARHLFVHVGKWCPADHPPLRSTENIFPLIVDKYKSSV